MVSEAYELVTPVPDELASFTLVMDADNGSPNTILAYTGSGPAVRDMAHGDDGESRLMPATMGVVPPERLEPALDAPGACVRQPEITEPWTWRYLWVAERPTDSL